MCLNNKKLILELLTVFFLIYLISPDLTGLAKGLGITCSCPGDVGWPAEQHVPLSSRQPSQVWRNKTNKKNEKIKKIWILNLSKSILCFLFQLFLQTWQGWQRDLDYQNLSSFSFFSYFPRPDRAACQRWCWGLLVRYNKTRVKTETVFCFFFAVG